LAVGQKIQHPKFLQQENMIYQNKNKRSRLIKKGENDVEYKLSSLANTQFKFIPTESPSDFLKKIATLCDLLDIKYDRAYQTEIEDEYFDDEMLSLKSNGCSFRTRRTDNGEHLITLKSNNENNKEKDVQSRVEYEKNFSRKEFKEIVASPGLLRKKFKGYLNVTTNCEKLGKVLTVKNKRTNVQIRTKLGAYILCYDKYYFYHKADGGYSEIYTEIEIEKKGDYILKDSQLDKLRQAIIQLCNYAPNSKAKLDQGLERGNPARNMVSVFVIALDIVGYSKKTADIQKQMIQRLGYFAKGAIAEIRGEGAEHELIFLPTGDGMILVFQEKPETLLSILFNLQKKIKNSNKNCPPAHCFEFRTGLHAGPVFKYSDVNGNLNFAGNGINIGQRVMSLGDSWHILATREGFEAMGNLAASRPYFFNLGNHTIKHGVEIEVFNVYSELDQFGNPANPLV
jgi:hypothetical protein